MRDWSLDIAKACRRMCLPPLLTITLVCGLSVLQVSALFAQQDELESRIALGLAAGIGYNILSGDLSATTLPGIIPGNGECGSFRSGSGLGPLFSTSLTIRLSTLFQVRTSVGYTDRSGTMRYQCVDPASARLPDGSVVPAITEHVAEITLHSFSGSVALQIRPFSIPLALYCGPEINGNVGKSFELREEIVTPVTAEFVSGGQVRPYGEGTFDEATVGYGLLIGAGYELPAGKHLSIRPDISGYLNVNEDVQTGMIGISSVRMKLGIEYRLPRSETQSIERPTVVELYEIEEEEESFELTATLRSTDGKGKPLTHITLNSAREYRTVLYPLLPYLFFEEGSAILPERYHRLSQRETVSFDAGGDGDPSILNFYYDILNLVGERLQRFPDATVTLIGTAPDIQKREDAISLAKDRATSIKEYLTDVWGINGGRIAIDAQHHPSVQSNPSTKYGRDENIRVEIISTHQAITEPVILTDTLLIGNSADVSVQTQVTGDEELSRWELKMKGRDGIVLAENDGRGELPKDIYVHIPPLSSTFSEHGTVDSLEFALSAQSKSGASDSVSLVLPTKKTLTEGKDRVSGEFTLILFDFARSDLREDHLTILKEVNTRISPSSRLLVRGYTDSLGNRRMNQVLSQNRAAQVARRLTGNVTESSGIGENHNWERNGFPEERMYARKVVVKIVGEGE